MSSSEGSSVNDGIKEPWCSLFYATVIDTACGIIAYGRGAQLIKLDIRNTYRVAPIHPDDKWLMGMMWEDSLLVDTALPFSLHSAPKIFTTLANAAEWMVRQQGVEFVIHYLDDFLVITAVHEHQGNHAMRLLLKTFEHLGLPIAWDKLEGPSPCLTFLGFELDSIRGEIRLSQQKLSEIRSELHRWLDKKSCTKRDLESLVGRLSQASPVVKPGKTFMRHLFEALTNPTGPPSCPPECLYSVGCVVVAHVYD